MTEFKPGIYGSIPENEYHQRIFGPSESLSATEAKTILRAPALLAHKRATPAKHSKAFDDGTLVHSMILGTGTQPVEIPEEILASNGAATTKKAKEFIAQARIDGRIPMRAVDIENLRGVVDAVFNHPIAGSLFSDGVPEQSMFCQDAETGVWLRGRVDWVTKANSGETLLVELKTSRSAQPTEFARNAASLNYAVQMEWYRAMWEQLTGEKEPRFLHVVVEKDAPYLVSVCEMNADFQDIGKVKMRQAIDIYKRCLDTGEWPGIPPVVHPLLPPAYYMAELLDLESEIEI